MSVKRSLDRHEPSRLDEEDVSFHEASTYFSEEEWTRLQEWQKELYRNVMKEIHQALISLGPLIATAVCSVRAKEKEEMCAVDKKSSESQYGMYHSPSGTIAKPDALFRIKRENPQHMINREDTRGVEINDCFRRGDSMQGPDLHLKINTQEPLQPKNLRDPDRRERNDCLIPGFTILNTDCMRKEEPVSVSIDEHGTEMEECSTDHISGYDIVSFSIKDEEEICCMDLHDSRRQKRIGGLLREPSVNRKKKAGESTKSYEGTSPCAFSGIINKTNLQSYNKEANSRSQMWPECYQSLRGEKTTQGESSFRNPVDFNAPTIGESDESTWMNSQVHKDLPSAEQNHRPCTYNDDDKSYSPTEEFIKCTRTISRVRPYACTECEKSFFHKSHLNTHSRVHSGEKPYICIFCHKSFHRKDNLNKHIRIHTGERPYKCHKCEKTFIQRSHLTEHQRKHT